jgi:predicted GNAT family N-acyltransferase
MNFLEIAFGSENFRQECELRNDILRVPLGLSLYEENLTAEREQMHFGLFNGDRLLACVIAVPLSSSEVKLRQMAVAAADQGRGCGSIIICCLEELLLISGFQHVCLNARISAAGFYAKLGFSAIGAQFIEVGIPHIKMQKKLGPQAVDASASGFE